MTGNKIALTLRQRRVARFVIEGFTNAQIAKALEISEDTVKNRVREMFNATGMSNRIELCNFIFSRAELHDAIRAARVWEGPG